MKNYDITGLNLEQIRQLEYLRRVQDRYLNLKEEWLAKVFYSMTVFLSIAAPLSLATDRSGSSRALTSAALLSAILSVLSGAVRLYARVHSSGCSARKVRDDTIAHNFHTVTFEAAPRFGYVAEIAFLGFAVLALLLLSLAVLLNR